VFAGGGGSPPHAIEYALLEVLIRHAGQVVTHRQLLDTYGARHAEQTEYLRVYMAHLRRKLEADPSRPRVFRTETGVGYRLLADDVQKPRAPALAVNGPGRPAHAGRSLVLTDCQPRL